MATSTHERSLFGGMIDTLEESAIALLLGLMVIITFVNVVLRYGFNSGVIWGLEATSCLFAWLVLLGVSYAFKKTAHLGVDAVIYAVPSSWRYWLGLLAGLICIAYVGLLCKGAWDYWANFANLPKTTGHWFPTGLEEMKRTSYRGWYEVVDIPLPEWLRWIEPIMNEGEAYEKLPRFIPYFILPFGMALFLLRAIQACIRLAHGAQETLIASHEAEEALDHLSRGK